jgi:hypothetical protein
MEESNLWKPLSHWLRYSTQAVVPLLDIDHEFEWL